MKILILLSFLIAAQAHSLEAGTWVTKSDEAGVPKLEMKINPPTKKVTLTLQKDELSGQKSIGIVFFDPSGKKTTVELKTMDPNQLSGSYEGNVTKLESFVGFEIKIPVASKKTIRSNQLIKVNP